MVVGGKKGKGVRAHRYPLLTSQCTAYQETNTHSRLLPPLLSWGFAGAMVLRGREGFRIFCSASLYSILGKKISEAGFGAVPCSELVELVMDIMDKSAVVR